MKFTTHLPLIITFLFAACTPDRTIPSTTITSITTATPATYLLANESWSPSYPTCLIQSNTIYAATPTTSVPASSNLRTRFPNGLSLQEYHSYRDEIHPVERGCWYSYRDRVHASHIVLDNSFQIYIDALDNTKEKVRVLKDNQTVYETEIRTFVYSGLLEAWGYEDHWVIEVMTQTGVDIIRDGKSLREINGYEKVFGFQLLANKPFYFFRKSDGRFGFNFDNGETELGYDNIPYTNPAPGMDSSVLQYQNMVVFGAQKGDTHFRVAIGVFNP